MMSGEEVLVLKNGSATDLSAIIINDNPFIIKNTCAFDSTFQLLYVGYLDYQEVKEFVDSNRAFIEIFDMIHQTALKNEITSKTYEQRCQILMNFFPLINAIDGQIKIVQCQSTISKMISCLFKKLPSLTVISTCNDCKCTESFSINHEAVSSDQLRSIDTAIHNYLKCAPCRCSGCQKHLATTVIPGTKTLTKKFWLSQTYLQQYLLNKFKVIFSLKNCQQRHLKVGGRGRKTFQIDISIFRE